jgi:thiol-disulfide isomerase/thioredoxin
MSETPTPDHTDLPDSEADGEAPEGEGRPSRRATWLAMGAVAVALGLIWLAPGINDTHVDDAGSEQTDFPGEPDDVNAAGKAAPLHFTLKDMGGDDVKLASFKGKVILLNFWATWCGPCKAEIPSLVELQDKYEDDLVILGLSIDDTVDKMKPYAAQYKINYPLLVGEGRDDVYSAFGITSYIPVSVIIGRDGKIAKKHSGIATKSQFEREIQALL